MDINGMAQIIGTLGVPTAMCVIIFYFLMQEQKTHKEEISELTKMINNLNISITQLTDWLKDGGKNA